MKTEIKPIAAVHARTPILVLRLNSSFSSSFNFFVFRPHFPDSIDSKAIVDGLMSLLMISILTWTMIMTDMTRMTMVLKKLRLVPGMSENVKSFKKVLKVMFLKWIP